jgi:hypothetical protein
MTGALLWMLTKPLFGGRGLSLWLCALLACPIDLYIATQALMKAGWLPGS